MANFKKRMKVFPSYFNGIYYKAYGLPGQSPVLFLHGFMGNHEDWLKIIERLSQDYYCIAVDLPGHGNSNDAQLLRDSWDFENLCKKLYDLICSVTEKQITVIGYSMGGRIAQFFSVTYPEKVNKLLLESTSPGIESSQDRLKRLQQDENLAERLQNEALKDFLDTWYDQSIFYKIKQHPEYTGMIQRKLLNNPGLLAQALLQYSIGNQPYLGKSIAVLRIPMQLLSGALDSKYCELMDDLDSRCLNSRHIILSDCGHNCHFEKPVLFAEHIAEFLSL